MVAIKASQKGFTLIELLITLALGGLLIAGIATSVSAITRAQNLTRDYGSLQETLSFFTATLARTARTAKGLSNATTNNLLSLDKKTGTQSCLAKEMTEPYTENFSLENNNLVCKVKVGENLPSSEVIAFGVISLNFDCAVFDKDNKGKKVAFEPCEKVLLNNVIAVRINLTLDKQEFLEINKNFNYSTTAYLRTKHQKLIDP